MDGLLVVSFFFPALMAFNFVVVIVMFFGSILFGFGEEIADFVKEYDTHGYIYSPNSYFLNLIRSPPFSHFTTACLICLVTLYTMLTGYALGGHIRYGGRKGWRFYQPCRGGFRFVLMNMLMWTAVAFALLLPWSAVEGMAIIPLVNMSVNSEKSSIFIASSALCVLANSLCVVALMSYEGATSRLSIDLDDIDNAKWSTYVGSETEESQTTGQVVWWLFMTLMGTLVAFATEMSVVLEEQKRRTARNKLIESILLMTIMSLMILAIVITNGVGGKWKHGERRFKLLMPFQGGTLFVIMQSIGWSLFSAFTLFNLLKLWGFVPDGSWLGDRLNAKSSSLLGFISYLFIAGSLMVFDPDQVKSSRRENGSSRNSSSNNNNNSKQSSNRNNTNDSMKKNKNDLLKIECILGTRVGANGAEEYLVQWQSVSNNKTSTVWVPHNTLVKIDTNFVDKILDVNLKQKSRNQMNDYNNNNNLMKNRKKTTQKQQPETTPAAQQAKRGRSKTPIAATTTTTASKVIWDEIEDEFGNVFFINTVTGESSRTLPKNAKLIL